jgi:aryl-alcohol dehydrogenase-like predicted oxidoreductase
MASGSKISLGTVQFGMSYGINNPSGIVSDDEISTILQLAYENGVDMLDTAHSYGLSETRLGRWLQDKPNFKIVSKTAGVGRQNTRAGFYESLKRLGRERIFGYLVHSFESFKREEGIWTELCKLKEEKQVDKIGFSLYYVSELDLLLYHDIAFDLIQVPYSVLDQRFAPYFKELHHRGVAIHTRSVFLQGLVFVDTSTLNVFFSPIRQKLGRLQEMIKSSGMRIEQVCLNFVQMNPWVDRVVVGVDNAQQFRRVMTASNLCDGVGTLYDDLLMFSEHNLDVLIPSRWKLQ